MPVTTIDTKTALIVVDLQKGIVNLPSIHPISGVIERSCALIDAFRQSHAYIDLPAKRSSAK